MAEPKTKVSDESAEIVVNDQGVPVIAGADFKVRQIAMDYVEMGNDVAGIQRQHPFLSRAQIRLAISYYLDNKKSFDAEIEDSAREYERLHRESAASPIRQKLRARRAKR
ncbi:MAG: DUF433 domain-containing protein [Caldilineaceae bacterium]|nr:DUF433 domain-containing protein [Caldilineaceae bacterium]MDE0632817.1 DUF433 domain-containing protein [Caldilineaceae bacterium]